MSDKLETAVNLAWTAGSNSTRFGIAAKYQLDKDASVTVSTAAETFRVGLCDYSLSPTNFFILFYFPL